MLTCSVFALLLFLYRKSSKPGALESQCRPGTFTVAHTASTEATVASSLVSASSCPNSPFPHTHTHQNSGHVGAVAPTQVARTSPSLQEGMHWPRTKVLQMQGFYRQSYLQNLTFRTQQKYVQRTIQVCLKTNWLIQTRREGHLWKLGRKLKRLTALRAWIFPGRTQPWPRW